MKQHYDKGIRLGFNAVALALIILGIMQAFAPYTGHDPREAEIRKTITRIVPVVAGDVSSLLRDPQGKPVMLVLYATWCGPCMIEFPHIMSLLQEGKLDAVKPVFLSLDYDRRALGRYLVHNDYDTLFTPYLFEGRSAALENALQASGGSFDRHIPYLAIFNARGKLVAEKRGFMSGGELLGVVDKL